MFIYCCSGQGIRLSLLHNDKKMQIIYLLLDYIDMYLRYYAEDCSVRCYIYIDL